MTAGVVAAVALAGCGGGDGGDTAARGDATAPATSSAGGVPEGTWSRVVTMRDAQERQVDSALATKVLGPDGEMPVELEVLGDAWKLYVTSDEGERELGDLGTFRTDSSGLWVTTSESPGCRGCVVSYSATVDGDRLTTEIDDSGAPAGDDTRLIAEGAWTRQS